MKKLRLISILSIFAVLNACKDSSSLIVPIVPKPDGTYQGSWSGMGNSGTITLNNIKISDDPDSDLDRVTGSLKFFNISMSIVSGKYNYSSNTLTLSANDGGANTYTFNANYNILDDKLAGSWIIGANSGTWNAKK